VNIVVDTWSQRPHVSSLEEENIPFELCKEFDKVNLRTVAHAEVYSTLGYTERSTGRREDPANKV
jgi:hypothetical protein